jgi:hypothetical protein
MHIKKFGASAGAALAMIALVSGTSTANAALSEDVNAAFASNSEAGKVAALQALSVSSAGDQAKFRELVQLVVARSAGSTNEFVGAVAGALGAACVVSSNNALTTRTIVTLFVEAYSGAGGLITASVIRAGCSPDIAAASLQTALVSAAGLSLYNQVSVLPAHPGTGPTLLGEPWVKSGLGQTTRLGTVNEGTQSGGQFHETAMSPISPD